MEAVKGMLAAQLIQLRLEWIGAIKHVEQLMAAKNLAEKAERDAAYAFRTLEMKVLDPKSECPSLVELDQAYKKREELLAEYNRLGMKLRAATTMMESYESAVNKAYSQFLKEP